MEVILPGRLQALIYIFHDLIQASVPHLTMEMTLMNSQPSTL